MNPQLKRLLETCRAHTGTMLTDSTGEWTGERLCEEVDRWRARFDSMAARRVAWQLQNGADWIAIDLALLVSGRIAVPVPDFFTPEQVAHVIATAGIDTWIGPPGATAPEGFASTLAADRFTIAARPLPVVPAVHPGTAKITFTSGSTGTARGVCLSLDKMLNTAAVLQQQFADRAIRSHLCVLPLSLLLENVAGVYANLLNGSTLHVPNLRDIGMTGSSTLDVGRFIQAQHAAQPHSIILVPQLLQALLGAALSGVRLPDSYRFIAVGGARVAPHLLTLAGQYGLPVHEGYGLSECGSVVTLNLPGASRSGSVGKPLDHVDITISDGEIHVSGSSMLGYLGDAAAPTRLATGDLGHLDADGYLFIDGRRKSCFISAYGRNVNPEWIESELAAQPEIALAAVFGEALPGNIAVLVPRTTDHAAVSHAVQQANARLPDYARVSAWFIADPVHFRTTGCMTATGKVRRDKVADVYAEPLAEATQTLGIDSSSNTAVRAPRTPDPGVIHVL